MTLLGMECNSTFELSTMTHPEPLSGSAPVRLTGLSLR